MRHAPSALAVALLAALAPLARADDDCRRLVEPLGPTTLARGTHALAFSPPTTQGQWFVSVRRAGPSGGRVDFNGQTVVPASQLAGPGGVYALAPVTLRPGSNTLTVSVTGQGQLTVAVHGLVAPEHLAPGQGRAVGLVTLFERTLAGGTPPRRETTSVTLPTTDGLFELELRQGTPPATTASLDWNGAPVLGQQALRPGVPVARAGVAVTDTNALATDVRGPAGSRVHVALRGWIVDEAAPTAAWTSPTPGAAVAPTDALVLAFADALTGVGSVRIDLDGVDVTASFAVGDAQATATAGQLPLRPGQNTLRAVVRDRACNETTATVSFTSGGAGDTTPPTLEQPPDLVAEQTSPAGAVVHYDPPAATDDTDPAPVVVCEPPPGALFAPGVTVVTCTATDASGNSAQVTFTVTVRDTTPPALSQPADLVVEQTSPAGAVVTYDPPTATDAADPAPVVVSEPPSGALFAPGVTVVTCSATDAAGNSAQVTFTVTVRDTTPPALSQPPDLVAEQTSSAGAVVTYDPPTATDAADPAPVVVCEPPSGALFAPGVTVVTCTATDAAGNSAQVTFTVTVRDTTPPALALTPADGATTSSPALLRAAWTDAGSGPDPASFQARLDGQDVTASFTVVADRATATLDLAAGARTFEVTLRDLAGNERVATSIFQVQAAAGTVARLELIVGSTAARRAAPDEEPLLTLAPEPRPIDGSGNDLTQPEEGRAGSRFLRLVAPDYADGHSAPAGPSRPGARAVSNGVHAQTGSVPAARRATDLLWIWGQFVGHDLSFTRPHDPAEPLPIPIPPNDSLYQYDAPTNHFPFLRSAYDPASSPREQRNELTAWLDGSMVYGSDDARAAALRTFEGGRLRTSAGDLLPRNTDALDPGPPTHFVAGDVRANQLTPLLALHTLFVREHNRLADLLRARHPDAPDEALYQGARRVVIAELQAITYQEFLPRLLGANGLPPSSGYDPAAQVGIFNEFAAAAFRLGHTLVSPHLLRLDAQNQPLGALDLRDAFFAPDRLTEGGGLDALLRGAARQPCQELDPLVVDGVRTYLFAPPGQGGLDLVALDLQRGRDHGLPAYNETRRRLGLPARTTFAEVTSDPLVRSRLAATYASIDDVDLLTGALCEDHLPGAMVGEILHQVLRAQFDLLRRGDRFFYEHAFSGPALDALRGLRLADVIRRNTGVGDELPDDVFTTPLEPFTENDLRIRALTEDGSLDPAFSGVVLVTSSDGRPPLDGLVAQLDQGQVTLPGLAFFQTVGTVVLTARTVPLDPGDPDASGTLAVEVVLQAPVIFPALPTSVAVGGELTIQGLSFVGQVVELVVDGQLVATEIAGPGGSFALTARLTPGAHQVLVRALDPTTGALVSSQSFTVDQAAPPAQALEAAPAALQLAVGQHRPVTLTERFAGGTWRDVTALADWSSSAPAVASVSDAGVVSGLGVGTATITATLGGLTVQVPVTVGVPILIESSPAHQEKGVAVTRETVFRFSAPLDPASVTAEAIKAEFGGQTLAGTLHVSKDRRTVTLFYAQQLPTSARVRVTVAGDLLRDAHGNAIDVDRDGLAGGTARIDFDTLTITVVPGTVAYGRVFSSRLLHEHESYQGPPLPGMPGYEGGDVGEVTETSVSVPLGGARIEVVGAEDTLFTFTDELGSFRLDPAPAGTFFVSVKVVDPERRLNYPDIGKPWTTIAGEETAVGDIYLPIIEDHVMLPVSDTEDVAIGFVPELLARYPHLAGTQLTIPAGSLYSVSGSDEEKRVGIAPVPPDRLPAPLPAGLSFSIVFTIQTTGGENFDVPAPARFPNLEGLPPGTKTALWSFNHDTGEWEVIGSMTVSADGLWVETDPGVGILAPGWHGTQSGAQGEGAETTDGEGDDRDDPSPDGDQEPTNGDDDCPAQCKYPCDGSVLLHSGEERLDRVDAVIPGRGDLSFVFRRRYRSRLDYDGPLGKAWDFDYDERLLVQPNGDVIRTNGRSHLDRWVRQPNGRFTAPPGFFGTLTQRPDGVYLLRERHGLQRFYEPSGLLASYVDRYGNRMDFVHDEHGLLDLVIDTYGREIDFVYQRFADGKRRLTAIRDFAGREWVYTYNALGQLTSVRSPLVVGTSTGNDFPAGRTERYTYSVGFADRRLNDNLLTVTSPEEVARGGPPSLVITYGTDPSDELTYDKVIAREEGGVNASGVAAGGRSTISYSLMNQDVPPGDKTVPRKRATIVDPRGNVRTSYVNEDDQHILDRIYTRGVREGEPEYFETRHDFNRDHQIVRTVLPSGDEVHYTYGSGSRAAERNVIAVRRVAAARGDGRGGPAEDLVTTFTYEPLFNRVLTVTDPRGNSATYTPPLGTNDPGRYTRRFFYDYMEHTDPVPLAVALGIDLSSVPRGLGDLNGDGRTDQSFGNVVRTEAPAVLLAPDSLEAARLGSTTQVIVTETRWNDRGQPIATVDAEGNVTLMAYHSEDDPDGDGLRTASAWRVLSAARTGYLRAITVDALDGAHAPRRTASAPAAALETTLRYDRVGNVVAVRNPRGVETHMEVTALNQVVVTTRGADVSQAVASGQLLGQEAPLRYKSRAFYDHDGRVVRTEVENRDSTTAGVGAWIERTLVYDILGGLLSSTVEVDATTHLTTTFRYDPNQNLVEVTAPEGTRLVTTYDERDLVHTVTRGPGTTDASTATVDYDLNGNRVRLTQAEHTPAQPKQTHFVFDGFDRLVEAIDALGGRALTHYDVASQVVRVQAFGHPAGAPGAAPVLMSDVRFSHDELGRVFRTDAARFVPGGQSFLRTPALSDHDGDGFVTARVDYDALSRATHVVEDDLQVTRTIYDGASRVIEVRDALGNRRLVQHDRNGNPVAATSVEVSAEGLVPPQGFTTRYVYDQLDRLIRATDNAGQTSRFGYDSRDNLVFRSDPEGALTADPLGVFPGTINAHGNTVTYHFDGLDRMIRQVIDLRVGGTGAGGLDLSNPRNPDGQVSLGYVFDGNSRLSAIVDDNGNRTTFGYDALNRRERQTNADGKSYLFQFDRDDNVRQVTDPNGSVITKTYDALNRLVELTVARGSGVVGTTRETYSYDGLSRLVRSTDDNGHAATALQVAEAAFDSLGRVLEERQNGRAVSSQYTGDGKRTQVMYPGGRTITRAFDAIDRIKQLKDGPTVLAHTDWIGPGMRELRRINANGTRLTFLNDAGNQDIGYDQVQRIVRLRVTGAGGAAIVDRIYGYNRASQRTLERRNDDFGLTDRYTYDSAYRVVASSYDQDGLPGAVKRELNAVSYRYDGVGNRRDVTKDVVGVGVLAEAYTVNAVNEYVSVAGVTRRHDDNGNLTDDGRRLLHYDYKNRLVAVSDRQTGAPVAAYEYLADGRRAKKKLFGAAGQVVKATAFFCDGAQEVEEQDATSGATEATYVWSPVYVDELVTYTNASGTFFTHQDARCNVVAITDAAGNVVERVRFDDFGRAEVRGPGGEVRAGSAVGCAYGFQGRRLDAETGLLYFRARYYDPETGRFLQRDPVWDAGNVGGQYTFCGNGPLSRRDPDGNSWLMDAFWDWAKCRVFFNAFGGNMSYDPNDIDQLWNDHLMRVEAANLVGGIADTAFDSGLAEFMSGMIPGIGLGGAGARGLASAAAGAGRSAGGLGRGTSAAAGAGRSAGAGARSSSGGAGAGARGTTSAGGGTSGGGVARGGAGGAGKSSQPPQAVPVNPRMGQESGSNITRWSDGSPRDLSRFQMTHQAEQRLADQAARSGKYQVIRPEAGAGAGDLGFIPKSGGPVRFAEVHAPTGAKAARGATKPAGQVTDTGMQNVLKSIDAQGRMPGVSQRGASKISETSVLKISEALGL